jgi:hypothetical protein
VFPRTRLKHMRFNALCELVDVSVRHAAPVRAFACNCAQVPSRSFAVGIELMFSLHNGTSNSCRTSASRR